MAKEKIIYVCDSCGNETSKWQGQCPVCKEWNSLSEFKVPGKHISSGNYTAKTPQSLTKVSENAEKRIKTGIREFDRVLGGGFVLGSIVLFGGEPGIGKSTLQLQVCSMIRKKTLYVSGEESGSQIKIRSKRLGQAEDKIDILSTQNLKDIQDVVGKGYQLLTVDSIQTVFDPDITGQLGGITQVKNAAYQLQALAKENDLTVVIIGHITKEGRVAGPKTLEHLVDTVLYLEGDQYHNQRIIRAVKNRFGSTGETGIFEMTSKGLIEVANPSALFLEQRTADPGSAVTAVVEGKRPLLLEVQALTERSIFGYPKRRAQGINLNRIEMLVAVLSKRTKLNLADKDVYVNIVGGLTIREPASDLAICLAIASSVNDLAIPSDLVAIGEIGLSGEMRLVNDIEVRLKEARRLGFKQAIVPKLRGKKFISKQMKIIEINTLKQALQQLKLIKR